MVPHADFNLFCYHPHTEFAYSIRVGVPQPGDQPDLYCDSVDLDLVWFSKTQFVYPEVWFRVINSCDSKTCFSGLSKPNPVL